MTLHNDSQDVLPAGRSIHIDPKLLRDQSQALRQPKTQEPAKQPKRRGRPPKNDNTNSTTSTTKPTTAGKASKADSSSKTRASDRPRARHAEAKAAADSSHADSTTLPSPPADDDGFGLAAGPEAGGTTHMISPEGSDGATAIPDKQSRLRARNRAAAQKCRIRKQRGVKDLQAQEAAAEACNHALTAEVVSLRGEVLMLKDMILQHGNCGNAYIQEYIQGAAQKLAEGGVSPRGHPQEGSYRASLVPPPPAASRIGDQAGPWRRDSPYTQASSGDNDDSYSITSTSSHGRHSDQNAAAPARDSRPRAYDHSPSDITRAGAGLGLQWPDVGTKIDADQNMTAGDPMRGDFLESMEMLVGQQDSQHLAVRP